MAKPGVPSVSDLTAAAEQLSTQITTLTQQAFVGSLAPLHDDLKARTGMLAEQVRALVEQAEEATAQTRDTRAAQDRLAARIAVLTEQGEDVLHGIRAAQDGLADVRAGVTGLDSRLAARDAEVAQWTAEVSRREAAIGQLTRMLSDTLPALNRRLDRLRTLTAVALGATGAAVTLCVLLLLR